MAQHYRVELVAEDAAPALQALHALLAAGVAPDRVRWHDAESAQPGLFDALPAAGAPDPEASGRITPDLPRTALHAGDDAPWTALGLPAGFAELARAVAMHADADRFAHLHALAWRLLAEPRAWNDVLAPERQRLQHMAQQVRREIHKMHAFVRFRPLQGAHGVQHVAWFEPQHAVVRAAAPFFARRFAAMAWSILTPRISVDWREGRLHFGPGAAAAQAPAPDAGEALWLAYYASIFNPARLNTAAMAREMPRRYWHNLPEARLITPLVASAPERSARMQALATRTTARRLPLKAIAAMPPPLRSPQARLDDLAARARHCSDCPLAAAATQTVWGRGAPGATLMVVGEQPGDQEDLAGQPFVGPAGQLLQRAMAQLGWPAEALYLTNAVKHFGFQLRGKRRLHKSPGQREAAACAQWLQAEIATVSPRAIVALGSTAASSVLDRPVRVADCAGRWLQRADGTPVRVVHHPAAVLRRAESGAPSFDEWVMALAQAWPPELPRQLAGDHRTWPAPRPGIAP